MIFKYLIANFLAINLCMAQGSSERKLFYVSSADGNHDAGLALFEMDEQTGKIEFIKEFDAVDNSSYLAISPNNQNLYTIRQPQNEGEGAVSAFSILDNGRELEFLNEKRTAGKGPCYVSINGSGSTLMTANYVAGNIATFQIISDGFIGDQSSNIYHMGSSINNERQEGPHPHMIVQAPESRLVLVPDLGTDKIMLYRLSDDNGLAPANAPYAEVEKGAGPRHFAFHPERKYGYVINELNATVSAFDLDFENEKLKLINTVSILPNNFNEFNKSADIAVTPDGKFVYATNRGHNSIALLKIDINDGSVNFVATFDCGGDWPRAFRLSPNGEFLLVANKNSGNIVVFKISRENGELVKVDENNQFPGPQCIRFFY